jgi:translation elongation factor P/translation initiation factor 5A
LRALSCAVLLTGTRVEKTFKSTDSAEGADVVDMNLTYLYNDGEFWHFMNNETFEQLLLTRKRSVTTLNGCWIRLSAS